MGDSGSNLIGFWVAWCAIYASQNQIYNVQPITMLWFVAIPFLDCVGLIFSRIKNGKSWTSAGRDHIHHKLIDIGLSHKKAVFIIILSQLSLLIFNVIMIPQINLHIQILINGFIISSLLLFLYRIPNK